MTTKYFKRIAKGTLLYTTVIYSFVFLIAIESVVTEWDIIPMSFFILIECSLLCTAMLFIDSRELKHYIPPYFR